MIETYMLLLWERMAMVRTVVVVVDWLTISVLIIVNVKYCSWPCHSTSDSRIAHLRSDWPGRGTGSFCYRIDPRTIRLAQGLGW